MFLAVAMASVCAQADAWMDSETGYTWWYMVNGDKAIIYKGSSRTAAISPDPVGDLTVPARVGGVC